MSTDKRRVFLYVMALVTLLNLGFLIAVLLIVTKNDDEPTFIKQELVGRHGRFMESELGFDENQLQTFHQSRMLLREQIMPLRNELRQLNSSLIVEATSENPDIEKCNKLAQQIGELQTEIKQVTVKHIIDVSNIATPDQMQQLKHFYLDMFQDDRPDQRPGQGKQHRMRRSRMPVEN